MPSKKTLERLGRELLAEIGLARPHYCLDRLHGFVRIENGGWRRLGAPWPTSTRESLFVLAHEIGHWLLHTEKHRGGVWWFRDGSTELVLEYEAELYAHRRLRDLGISVPRWITRVGRRRAAALIHDQLRTTSQTPDEGIARWAGVDIAKERRAEWGVAAWKRLPRVGTRGKPPDLLIGRLCRRPRAGTKVDVLLITAPGTTWALEVPLVQRNAAGRHQARIENMMPLVRSAAGAGLVVSRF